LRQTGIDKGGLITVIVIEAHDPASVLFIEADGVSVAIIADDQELI
jgi:hypothetical protein